MLADSEGLEPSTYRLTADCYYHWATSTLCKDAKCFVPTCGNDGTRTRSLRIDNPLHRRCATSPFLQAQKDSNPRQRFWRPPLYRLSYTPVSKSRKWTEWVSNSPQRDCKSYSPCLGTCQPISKNAPSVSKNFSNKSFHKILKHNNLTPFSSFIFHHLSLKSSP